MATNVAGFYWKLTTEGCQRAKIGWITNWSQEFSLISMHTCILNAHRKNMQLFVSILSLWITVSVVAFVLLYIIQTPTEVSWNDVHRLKSFHHKLPYKNETILPKNDFYIHHKHVLIRCFQMMGLNSIHFIEAKICGQVLWKLSHPLGKNPFKIWHIKVSFSWEMFILILN